MRLELEAVWMVAAQLSGKSSTIIRRYDVKSLPVFERFKSKSVWIPTSASRGPCSNILASIICGIVMVRFLVTVAAMTPEPACTPPKVGDAVTGIVIVPARG